MENEIDKMAATTEETKQSDNAEPCCRYCELKHADVLASGLATEAASKFPQ
jgi:hypothetical protein